MDNSNGGPRTLTCPFCSETELQAFGRNSLRCDECGGVLGGALLETLHMIVTLPDAFGGHACECGHPEMRHLPTAFTDVRPADLKSRPSPPRCAGSPRITPKHTGAAGSTAVTEIRNCSRTTPVWPSGKALQSAWTTTAATAPATKPVCGRPGSSKPHSTSSRSSRADHQVVATLPLTGVVEAVPHVSLEVQRISLHEHILLTT